MPSVENIRNSLIDKILSIKNKRFLMALDKLISSSQQSEPIALTEEQKEMLQMSQVDIESGQILTQHELDELDREWLNSQ